MDTALLRKAGLTESQAKGYLALIEHGALSPADLAEKTSESRTNGYMICEKLEQLGLATKKEGKKALYTPNHPSALETLAEKRRKALVRNEQEVKGALPSLIDFFYQHQSTPGVEFGYGSDGVEKIRARTLAKGQKLYFVRTGADQNYDQEKLAAFINHRVAAGIQAQSLAPTNNTHTRSQEQLEAWLLDRTLLPAKQYTAPVEVDIFGDTVAFIDFENDGMSTMITSQNIADAMRQLFLIAKESTDDQTPS